MGLLVALLVAVNLYLQSEGVQNRIRQATAASLGVPVEMKGASYLPWAGLTLSGISAPDPADPAIMLFEARHINVRLAILPLLSRQIVITSISIREPVISASDGSIPLLLAPPKTEVVLPEDPEELPEGVVTAEPVPRAEPVEPVIEPTEEKPPAKRPPTFTVEVQNFRIRNGRIVMREGRRTVAVLEGIRVESRIARDFSVKGRLQIEEIAFQNRLFLRNFTAPFERKEGIVTIEEFTGNIGNGLLHGAADVAEETGAFEVAAALTGVEIPELAREAGIDARRMQGLLVGDAKLSSSGDPDSLAGRVEFQLIEATLEPVDFIRQVGQLLSVSELQLLELTDARIILELLADELLVEDFTLQTQNMILQGAGQIDTATAELDLDARMLLHRNLTRNLRGLMGSNFQESELDGYQELPFRVFGTVDRPRTDLLEKFTGGSIGAEVGRFLQNILGAPPDRKEQ